MMCARFIRGDGKARRMKFSDLKRAGGKREVKHGKHRRVENR
jgi:hypothetical protein